MKIPKGTLRYTYSYIHTSTIYKMDCTFTQNELNNGITLSSRLVEAKTISGFIHQKAPPDNFPYIASSLLIIQLLNPKYQVLCQNLRLSPLTIKSQLSSHSKYSLSLSSPFFFSFTSHSDFPSLSREIVAVLVRCFFRQLILFSLSDRF